jgi:hypothetical protein
MLKQQNACFFNVLYLCFLNNCITHNPPLSYKRARVAHEYNHLYSNEQEKLPYLRWLLVVEPHRYQTFENEKE